jgi:group I intron endonuclease
MIIYSIYKIVNKVNGKVYIGYTNNFNRRKSCHIHLSKSSSNLIHKSIKKYGKDNFDWEIIYQSKHKSHTLKAMESHFIQEYNSLSPSGYNICPGGGGGISYEKTRQRMVKSNPGKTKKALEAKTSIIIAHNSFTNQEIIVDDRKSFSIEHNIPYTSIGWAIQNNKTLKNGWRFRYLSKRTMGI